MGRPGEGDVAFSNVKDGRMGLRSPLCCFLAPFPSPCLIGNWSFPIGKLVISSSTWVDACGLTT